MQSVTGILLDLTVAHLHYDTIINVLLEGRGVHVMVMTLCLNT